MACSAACSVESSVGISSSPSSCVSVGTYQTASVSKVVAGRSSWTVAIVAWSRMPLRWYATTCSVTETRPNVSSRPSRRSVRSGSSIAGRRLLLHLRVPVAGERFDDRVACGDVELSHEPRLSEVEVDGAFVHGRVRALALDDPEQRAGGRVDHGERVRGPQSAAAYARRGSPCPRTPSRASFAGGRGRAGARSTAASPSVARSSSSTGASNAAAARWPSRTRGFAWSRIAASTRRPSSVSGSRMKYWSSASSEATSTASPWPRRPARPHCWRRLAIVPGKPTEIAQSRRPMSMPSSSASVADTPSSSPSTSLPLDVAALLRRVAGAVGREPLRGGGVDPVGGHPVHELRGLAALREADRPQAAVDERSHQPRCLAERARARSRARRRGAPGSTGRSCARRAAPRRPRPRSARCRAAGARARRGSRSSPTRARTAGRCRTRAPGAGGDAGRSPRASRTRRDTRAPRRRRHSGGCASTSAQRSCRGSTPTWSMSGFVRMTFDHFRTCHRCSRGVSPS